MVSLNVNLIAWAMVDVVGSDLIYQPLPLREMTGEISQHTEASLERLSTVVGNAGNTL